MKGHGLWLMAPVPPQFTLQEQLLMQANNQYIPNGTQNSDNVEQIKQAIVDSAKPNPAKMVMTTIMAMV